MKPLLRDTFGTSPSIRLIEVVKVAQRLLTINTERLICSVIKLHVVNMHYLLLPT